LAGNEKKDGRKVAKMERLTCSMAWTLNRDSLINKAQHNTFNALAIAFETAWNLATEEAERKKADDG